MFDTDIVARTLYGEARGEGIKGIEAVACVIQNRYKACRWFTGYIFKDGQRVPSLTQTCLKNGQFSCWNQYDRNCAIIKKVNATNKIFQDCLIVAKKVVEGKLKDFTGGATHYHTRQIMPCWARGKTPCFEYKNHIFYKDV